MNRTIYIGIASLFRPQKYIILGSFLLKNNNYSTNSQNMNYRRGYKTKSVMFHIHFLLYIGERPLNKLA